MAEQHKLNDHISLIDTHCHVNFPHYSDDRDAMFERMSEAGVDRCIVVAVDLEHVSELRALSESRDNVWFSAGVHPNHEVAKEPTVDELLSLAEHPRCVAIGESGMDFFRNSVEPELQESRFRTHLQAAKACNKPIIVHDRNADEASIRILTDEGADRCGGIMHCFSSDWQTAKQAIDLGFSISFSGNVTFKNNPALREVAAQVPDDLLLIETDSPYLTPVPYRGKRNEPAYVRHIAECIADVRGVSLETLAKQTTANALKRFNIGA